MPRQPVDLLILHARLCGPVDPGHAPRGEEMDRLWTREDGALAVTGGLIRWVGDSPEAETRFETGQTLDLSGRMVLPGFVDSHTHPIFGATREAEFELRVRGKTYQEIARAGGGIRSSVRTLRATPAAELRERAGRHLDRMLAFGTTTAEAKSGYGLSLESELRQLEVIRDLAGAHPVELVPTFLGAHEIPDEYRENRGGYVRLLVEEMIPAVAKAGLARFCDIFCEPHVFGLEESRRILLAARDAGLGLKLHADELEPLGGAELAAELGAVSADHLVAVSPDGVRALARAGTIATLLPATTLSLGLPRFAPARDLISAGVPVALATDFNPGSCHTESIPLVLSLACTRLRMTPAEALCAATLGGAYAVGLGAKTGSLTPGKQADLTVWEIPSLAYLPYHVGAERPVRVLKRGRTVCEHDPEKDLVYQRSVP